MTLLLLVKKTCFPDKKLRLTSLMLKVKVALETLRHLQHCIKGYINLPRKSSLFHVKVHLLVTEIICVIPSNRREEASILLFRVLIVKGQEVLSINKQESWPYNIAFCSTEIRENTFFW